MRTYVEWNNPEALRALFVGKSVTELDDSGRLVLSDGTVAQLVGNADCCAYYDLKRVGKCPNIITNVDVYADPDDDGRVEPGVYRLFVFADNERINLAEFEGTDSSGYYGTGFWLEVEVNV